MLFSGRLVTPYGLELAQYFLFVGVLGDADLNLLADGSGKRSCAHLALSLLGAMV